MKRKLSVFLVSFLLPINIAIAADANLSWTPPVQNTDGSVIAETCAVTPGSCLAGYNIYYGLASGVYDIGSVNIPDPNAVEYTITGLDSNTTYYFVATAYNVDGQESDYSGEATKTTAPLRPNPPLNLTVNPDNLTAYTYSISVNKVVMIPVGTVPSDTPCDPTMSMNGYYLVDTNAVELLANIQPPVAFADCV